ncbi:GDSL-type esterase/lipase family protein, partial [Pelomonas sp. KK5]|uniref:GDSL-type esterase/lipase family protein n=1 Tax=Pelomonas sp. KK5 TaxID=1855730 RepID=UPI0009FA42F2
MRLQLLALFALLAGCAGQTELPPVRLILVGDSTLAPNNGYGDALCARLKPQVACLNVAKNGRSSGSFRAEGLWDAKVLAPLADKSVYKTSYVLIEFGHNDQPGKPGRSTDLKTEFPINIARYVDEVRAAGGTPLLATPLTRRSFDGKEGRLQNDLQPWADATKRIAAEKQVPLIDLLAASGAAVQAMGQAEA